MLKSNPRADYAALWSHLDSAIFVATLRNQTRQPNLRNHLLTQARALNTGSISYWTRLLRLPDNYLD